MSEVLLSGIPIKTMHALESQTVKLGICPKCHDKSLIEKYHGEFIGYQCSKCLSAYIVEAA